MARIAIAGFLHETNTFSRRYADFDAFAVADAWPGLAVGEALFDSVAGANLASAGFIAQARQQGHELLPVLWASASPSGCVTRDAYEKIWSMMEAGLRAAGRVDALFLDLHGAMVAAHQDDGEGELLTRIRRLFGPAVPIVLTLDFHANVSPRMMALADAVTLYRSYPHVDMADAGARAALLLQRLLDGDTLHKAYRQLDFLIPMLAQCTLVEPFSGLMRELAECERDHAVSAEIAAGFPLADTSDCGPAVLAYGADAAAAEAVAQRLYEAVRTRRPHYTTRLYTPEEAVRRALAHRGDGPFIIADTQDNPGGGGSGDTSDMLHELVSQQAGACVGLLCDPAAAQAAHLAGVGASVELELGGHAGIGAPPLKGRFRVESLGDGEITGTGPFYLGCRMALGPMACLRLDQLLVLVSSRKQQAADQAMFRHLGVEPGRQRVLVLKSSIHFRADFGAIAGAIICVEAPGENVADISKLHYSKLRAGLSRA